MKPKIFVTRKFPGEGIDILLKAEQMDVKIWDGPGPILQEELLAAIRDVQGIVSTSVDVIDANVMNASPDLKVISNYAVGYDNIDIPEATRRGIMVTNTPGVLTDAVADLTVLLILGIARRVTEAERYIRTGQWKLWYPDVLLGQEIAGSTLGLVGFGRIGQAVAKRVQGFDMNIVYTEVDRILEAEKEYNAQYVDMEKLLQMSDFVSIHVPLIPATRKLMGEKEFKMMKPTAYLINTSRGPVVDEAALYEALSAGEIAGAGLDVFEHEPLPADSPLLRMDKVVLMPHLGSATHKTRGLMGVIAVKNMVAAMSGKRPPNLVNLEAWAE